VSDGGGQLDLRHLLRELTPGPGWPRWAFLLALLGLVAAGLAGVFGQSPETTAASGPRASLQVQAPERLRGGLYYQGRFVVQARERLQRPTIVLDRGWLEQMSINSIVPQPEQERSTRDGRLELVWGPLAAGARLVAYVYFQVNPTNVGAKSQDAELRDGAATIARVQRDLLVFP